MAAAPPRSDARALAARPGEQVRARARTRTPARVEATRRGDARPGAPPPDPLVSASPRTRRASPASASPPSEPPRAASASPAGPIATGSPGIRPRPRPGSPRAHPRPPLTRAPPPSRPPLAQQPDKTTSRLIKPSASTPTSPPPRPRGTASTTRREPAARPFRADTTERLPPRRGVVPRARQTRRRRRARHRAIPRAHGRHRRRGAGDGGDARCPPNAAPPGAGPLANAPIVSSVGRGPLAAAAAGSGPAAFPGDGVNGRRRRGGGGGGGDEDPRDVQGEEGARRIRRVEGELPPEGGGLSAAASSSAAAAAPVARVANPRADFLVSAAATFGAADPSSASVSRWAAFAGTAIASLVPAAPSGLLRAPGPPRGYKITIGAVESYAFGPEAYRASSRGGVLEARVALSFYDETAGSFHGRTCSSAPRAIRLPPAAGDGPGAMPVGTLDCGPHEAFFVTRVADPRCLIVAEVVIVERDATSGAVVRETTGGWAAIPSRGANGEEPPATASPPGGEPASTAPMRAGSPRYLMWGRPRAGQHPPSPLGAAGSCATRTRRATSSPRRGAPRCSPRTPSSARARSSPGSTAWTRERGGSRARASGTAARRGSAAFATPLARPTLAPTRKVALRGVRVALPAPFATLVAASPATAAALGADPGSAPPNVRALAQNPAACAAAVASARCVSVRVQAHNGRRFVGDAVVVDAFEGAPGPGPEPAIGVRAPVVLDGVPQDQLVALVVEVLFRPPGSDPRAAPACVGWAATAPFCEKNPPSKIAPPTLAEAEATADANRVVAFDGGLDVAAGPRAFAFASVRGPRAAACADWRAVVRAPPEAWRDAAGPRGADARGFRATFELAVAPGDVDVEAKHRELVAAAKQRDADLARAPSVDVAASALAKVSTAAGGGGGEPGRRRREPGGRRVGAAAAARGRYPARREPPRSPPRRPSSPRTSTRWRPGWRSRRTAWRRC